MAIKIYSDRIEIGDKIITATPVGIRIDDSLLANTQNNRVASTNFTAKEFKSPQFGDSLAAYYGTVTGYSAGGYVYTPTNAVINTITKFPLVSGYSGTAYGGVTLAPVWSGAGVSSRTHGYIAGGSPGSPTYAADTIQKFSFTAEGNATDVGNLVNAPRSQPGGHADWQRNFGYISKGYADPTGGQTNTIQKWPFSSDTNATDVGDATAADWAQNSWSTFTHGIMCTNNVSTNIDRFPFATDTNATEIGDVSPVPGSYFGTFGSSLQSGTTAYAASGQGGAALCKFPFATALAATSSTMGTTALFTPSTGFRSAQSSGVSSADFGFICGGGSAPPTYPDGRQQIDRFAFASETLRNGVGDLNRDNRLGHSQQY